MGYQKSVGGLQLVAGRSLVPTAFEYMKMSCFIPGLEQEIWTECNERGFKPFNEAFHIASQSKQSAKQLK